MAAKDNNGGTIPHFVTIDTIEQERRVVWLDKEDQPYAAPFQYSCQALGICKNRYPACGQCDDDHPEDEPPTPTPFESLWVWLVSAVAMIVASGVAGYLLGYFTAKLLTP